ncbi:hypothetical protein AB0I10_08275 [Streptomyces sp. NPDC050636]|uniref:hypothetical protein n=1 Tax=Streptomyces sp. NPDC050636 TaxID=3154510 RepID=UPI00342B2A8C
MQIRHVMQTSPALRYASVAGALAASVTLSGAATATATVTDTASGDPKQVIIQPDAVAPGGDFSVFDGGNCTGESGEASFEGGSIPTLPLSMLNNQVGGTGTVPQTTKPGTYKVTVTCGAAAPDRPGEESSEKPADEGAQAYGAEQGVQQGTGKDAEQGADEGAEQGAEQGTEHGAEEGREHGDGQHKFTGTLTVSGTAAGESRTAGDSEQVVPGGGSNTGLGGGSGSGLNTGITVLGGTLLAGAVGWAVVIHRRRTRGG